MPFPSFLLPQNPPGTNEVDTSMRRTRRSTDAALKALIDIMNDPQTSDADNFFNTLEMAADQTPPNLPVVKLGLIVAARTGKMPKWLPKFLKEIPESKLGEVISETWGRLGEGVQRVAFGNDDVVAKIPNSREIYNSQTANLNEFSILEMLRGQRTPSNVRFPKNYAYATEPGISFMERAPGEPASHFPKNETREVHNVLQNFLSQFGIQDMHRNNFIWDEASRQAIPIDLGFPFGAGTGEHLTWLLEPANKKVFNALKPEVKKKIMNDLFGYYTVNDLGDVGTKTWDELEEFFLDHGYGTPGSGGKRAKTLDDIVRQFNRPSGQQTLPGMQTHTPTGPGTPVTQTPSRPLTTIEEWFSGDAPRSYTPTSEVRERARSNVRGNMGTETFEKMDSDEFSEQVQEELDWLLRNR